MTIPVAYGPAGLVSVGTILMGARLLWDPRAAMVGFGISGEPLGVFLTAG